METLKKISFITESQALYIEELQDRLSITEEDKDNGYIQDFFACDPDYIKTRKTDGRGQVPFVVVSENETTYIITPDELDDIEVGLVKWFLDGAKGELEIENNWQSWQDVNTGIAYRGGRGYCYSLYAKS